MNPEAELHDAYTEWRRLAEAEGEGIRAGNWSFVSDCQRALSQIRSNIDNLTQRSRTVPASPTSVRDPSFRPTILHLIELERRNLAWLQERREKLSAHVEQLSRTGRNLRGIQRSYASRKPAGWSSYS